MEMSENEKREQETQPLSGMLQVEDARIAIVDDNKVNLQIAATILREFGARPEAFSRGSAILKALDRGRRYDIIFMDHMMPEMDGLETTRQIRSIPEDYAKEMAIVALTANNVEDAGEEYLAAGMNDWLCKPVEFENFQEKLVKFLPPEKQRFIEE